MYACKCSSKFFIITIIQLTGKPFSEINKIKVVFSSSRKCKSKYRLFLNRLAIFLLTCLNFSLYSDYVSILFTKKYIQDRQKSLLKNMPARDRYAWRT